MFTYHETLAQGIMHSYFIALVITAFVSKFCFQSAIVAAGTLDYAEDLTEIMADNADESLDDKKEAFLKYMKNQMEDCNDNVQDAVDDISNDPMKDAKSDQLDDMEDEYDDLELDPAISNALANNDPQATVLAVAVIDKYCAEVQVMGSPPIPATAPLA